MPDVNSIPFRQADPNGHYRSKQLPNDQGDFLLMLGLPEFAGDVVGPAGATANQVAVFANSTGKHLAAASGTGIAKLTTGVLSVTPAPSGAIVGTTDVQTLTNKTLTNPVITGLTGLTKADVGLANVDNTSDLAKPISTAQQAALNLKEDKTNKGIANGYASLDASTKIPMSQIPDALVGASQYQGTWNAATNTPVIPTASAGNKGWYYSVSVAGTTNINGINSWAVGDQIISNGTAWEKIPNVSAVNSVNGYTGTVVIAKADVGLSNVDNTSDATKNSAIATLTNKTLTAPVINNPTGIVKADVGLANVDNTSDATKNAAVATLTNKTLNSPVINTPTGITKADVGLANVDNTSDATKNAAAATLTNKTINGANNTLTVRLDADVVNNLPVARLNSGTGANSGSFWRGDGQWAPPAGGGDIVGPTASVDGELPLYSGTTGKVIKRCNLSGFVKAVANGAATAQSTIGSGDIASGAITNLHPNVSMITGQTAKTGIVSADQVLLYDSVSAQLRKASLSSAIWSVRQRSFNAIGNPNFEIDQARAGTTTPGLGAQAGGNADPVDRWWTSFAGSTQTARFSCGQQTTGRPTLPGTNVLLGSAYERITLTTQQASMAAGDFYSLSTTVEGCDARELLGDVHSLQLLVRSSVADLKFAVAVLNAPLPSTRSLVQLCTLGAANTWTLFTFPNLPLWDAGVTWSSNPGEAGYHIYITLAAGTTYLTSTLGSWVTGNFIGATGMDNFCSKSTNSTFDFGFVQHEPGPDCSTLIDVPWQDNYQRCQRYYQKSYNYAVLPGTATYNGAATMFAYNYSPVAPIVFPVKMAKIPTMTSYSPQTGLAYAAYNSETASDWSVTGPTSGAGESGFSGFNVTPGPSINLKVWYYQWVADASF